MTFNQVTNANEANNKHTDKRIEINKHISLCIQALIITNTVVR